MTDSEYIKARLLSIELRMEAMKTLNAVCALRQIEPRYTDQDFLSLEQELLRFVQKVTT